MVALDRPVDAARIREVLAKALPYLDENYRWHRDTQSHAGQITSARNAYDAVLALLRDLDAQGPDESGALQDDLRELLRLLGLPDGAAPQSPHKVFQEALGVLRKRLDTQGPAPAGRRLVPEEPTMEMLEAALAAPVAPSPALDARTVEAVEIVKQELARGLTHQSNPEVGDYLRTELATRIVRALLTSGAEAGEHPRIKVVDKPAKPFVIDEGDSDRGASARPLSEWSDDELFRALDAWTGFSLFWAGSYGAELRSRGWQPWNGSGKAPVEGEVQVWLRNARQPSINLAAAFEWEHPSPWGPNHEITAYRAVAEDQELIQGAVGRETEGWPAERSHVLYKTGDDDAPNVIKDRNGEVVLGLCRICRKAEAELDGPCERAAPAADAGEVERLAEKLKQQLLEIKRGLDDPVHEWEPVTAESARLEKALLTLHELKEAASARISREPEGLPDEQDILAAALRPAPTEEQIERAALIIQVQASTNLSHDECLWLARAVLAANAG